MTLYRLDNRDANNSSPNASLSSEKTSSTNFSQVVCNTAMYMGAVCAPKPIYKQHIEITRKVLLELNQVKLHYNTISSFLLFHIVAPKNVSFQS
jgi:hypothetical protein